LPKRLKWYIIFIYLTYDQPLNILSLIVWNICVLLIKMAISYKKIEFFQIELLSWFKDNGRAFPWRKPKMTTYQVIISEILLQRTKAETVAKFLPYFLKEYPNWKKIGTATEKELEVLLKPLGLQSQRSKRLFKLSQAMKERKGRFPKKRSEVETIPMMGQYLTNAYELFVLNKKSPLLDVNMARLLERFFGPRKLSDIRYDPYLQDLAYRVVNTHKSKEINWAILDYSAIVCKAITPLCDNCILSLKCSSNK